MNEPVLHADIDESPVRTASAEGVGALSRFLAVVKKAPMLSAEEERSLARRLREGDLGAQNRLVASHLRLVVRMARRYRTAGVPLGDLIQEGTVGLMQAIRRFNPERVEARLSTYAAWWVRAALQDYMLRSLSLVRMGTTVTQKSLLLRLRTMKEGFGEDWTAKLAHHFGVTMNEVTLLARRLASPDRSLDRPLADGEDGTWVERLPSGAPDPEEQTAEREQAHVVSTLLARALSALPERERTIIRKRYLAEVGPSLETLARELDLSKERVRVLEKRALARLRAFMAPALAQGT